LNSALAHDVKEEHAALSCIDEILLSGGDVRGQSIGWDFWKFGGHAGNLLLSEASGENGVL
jgi:hypothetical protein